MRCPRREESPHISAMVVRDTDLVGDKCTYCGSISQEAFFAAIAINCKLCPTDKSYKVYVYRPNGRMHQRRIVGTANHSKEGSEGWKEATQEDVEWAINHPGGMTPRIGEWILYGPEEEYNQDKFYFQHLDADGRQQLVRLMNSNGLKLDAPGYFYVLPFFVKPLA